MLAVLDELPSTAPIPTLRTRMANERALGLSFIYATQTWRQLMALMGEQDARALLGLTNNLAMFGGSKDIAFNKEMSELIGTTKIARTTYQSRGGVSTTTEHVPVIRPEEIRELPERQVLLISENSKPLIAKLSRCIDGPQGAVLKSQQAAARNKLAQQRSTATTIQERSSAAIAASCELGLRERA